jgi:hypothetical protein
VNGFVRFVEEVYRGEPQRPIWRKPRFYHWIEIVSVISIDRAITKRTSWLIPELQFN